GLDPFIITDEIVPECSKCTVSGFLDYAASENEGCIHTYPHGTQTFINGTRRTRNVITFPKVKIDCECRLPCNPGDKYKKPIVGCNARPTAEGKPENAKLLPLNLAEGVKKEKCVTCSKKAHTSGRIIMEFTGLSVTFNVWTKYKEPQHFDRPNAWDESKEKTPLVTDFAISNVKSSKSKCEGDTAQFKTSCHCLLATQFFKQTVLTRVLESTTFPCRLDSFFYDYYVCLP
uniref:Uncharacterized protein n=1 Tax=Strigamia maritima TaxID=126957 RepID=T1JAN7_STRMM